MNAGRLRLFHLQEQTEATGADMDRERARFDRLADRDPARVVTSYNLFETPVDLARQMAEELGELPDGCRVLEPSAGLGRLYRAVRIRNPRCRVTLVDNSAGCCEELYRQCKGDTGAVLIQEDFLSCDLHRLGGYKFDRIIMNPPFSRGRDCRHIMHAANFLRPGGRLVSLCYAGVKQRAAFEQSPQWTWRELPSGSFKSEGTQASTAMVTHQREEL